MKPISTLKTRADFASVRRNGKSVRLDGLILSHVPTDELLLGIVITKKVGNAVVRNRLRRQIKASAAEVLTEGTWVVVAHTDLPKLIAERGFVHLQSQLEEGFQRLH